MPGTMPAEQQERPMCSYSRTVCFRDKVKERNARSDASCGSRSPGSTCVHLNFFNCPCQTAKVL